MAEAPRTPLNERVVLSPLLSVRGASQAIEFYKQAFGAEALFEIGDDSTSIVARLAIGKAEFWVADESPAHENYSPASLNGSTVRIILIVDDPDALAAQAVSAGATVVYPVADQSYGWRVGRVVDPFGHHWEIGKPIDDLA
jgi:PhnB protein